MCEQFERTIGVAKDLCTLLAIGMCVDVCLTTLQCCAPVERWIDNSEHMLDRPVTGMMQRSLWAEAWAI
jgi:hypothetical protein